MWPTHDTSSMNASEYKKYHESFMANNHGSTAVHTFFCIFFTVQCSLFISIGRRKTESVQFICEYMIMVLPMIAAHTILHQYIYVLNLIAFAFLLYKLAHYYPKLEFRKTFCLPNHFQTKQLNLISCLRGLTYLITVYSILAVDFLAFPRNLAKTERYGYSLMDSGVGLFVLMSGLVHKELCKDNYTVVLKSNTKFMTIVVTLGIARFVSLKLLDYPEHISEYGLHWNFFFTLAVCKLIATVMLFFSNRPFLFSVITVALHEFLLYHGLQGWVFSYTPRSNFLSANREGITSCLGYTSLYLFAAYLKGELKNASLSRYKIFMKLVFGSFFLWILLNFVNNYRPISRTLANASYCIYLVAILLTLVSIMYLIEVLSQDKNKIFNFDVPLILSVVNTNGLLYFVISNLLTGAINLTVNTFAVSNSMTFVILNCYMVLGIALAVYLKKKGVKI